MIKLRTKYEKESFIKSFLLFFFSIEVLLFTIAYLYYQNQKSELKNKIFLEMKNYSFNFEGEKFSIDIIKKPEDKSFYQLYEDDNSLYMFVQIPGIEEDVLKIKYPKDSFNKELAEIKSRITVLFLIFSCIALIMSVMFSMYSIYPLRNGLKLIDQFVKDIIHDLNTPVSSILINLKLLKIKYKDGEIDRLENAVKQLNLTYENLRDLIKETEKIKTETDVVSIVKDEINSQRNLYPDVKVNLYLKPLKLKTDERAVRRIISNLISNAFKHNIKNGWVEISVEDRELTVRNTSKPVKNPDRVFERYYRESKRGIGIGLSIVKKLCDEIGCEISFSYGNGVTEVRINFKEEKK